MSGMTGGVWKEDGAEQILNITPGQGRPKLADSGTSPRAKRWALASRAPRVQEAWAGYPLRPATPLWILWLQPLPQAPAVWAWDKGSVWLSLKAGWGRPALPRHGRTGAQGPPVPVPAVITGKGWGMHLWGFPAASVLPLRRRLRLSISFKRKTTQKTLKLHYFFKHF